MFATLSSGLAQPYTFIGSLEEQLQQRKDAGLEILACETSFIAYCTACNAALLQFLAAYWDEIHPSLDIKFRQPFCNAEFRTIRLNYAHALNNTIQEDYGMAMESLRVRGDVQIAASLTSWFDHLQPWFTLRALPPLSDEEQFETTEPVGSQSTPQSPAKSTPVRTSPEHTPATARAAPSIGVPAVPPPEVLRFSFSPFNSMANVVHDYLKRTPCLRDIERSYGPDVRRMQHWRSKEYQTVERQQALKKECSRRKSIHIVLDLAYDNDDIDSKVNELNEMMIDNFQLTSIEMVKYPQMTWLAKELSKSRIARGLTFQERSSNAAKVAAERKKRSRPDVAGVDDNIQTSQDA